MTPEALEKPNPFDEFETVAQIYGFIFKKFGDDGLRELLAMSEDWTSERLERAAGCRWTAESRCHRG